MKNTNEHVLFQVLNAFLEALPEKFKRERKDAVWPPHLVAFAVLLMSMDPAGRGYNSLLGILRVSRQEILANATQASSFCRARKKLTGALLDKAWQAMRATLENLVGDLCPVVQGYRLVGIDGVWINASRSKQLFKELRKKKRGRPPKDPKGQPQMLVVALVDVLTKTPIAWECVGAGQGERKAAVRLSAHLNKHSILLADRGFPSRKLLEILTQQDTKFIIRMTSGASAFSEVTDFHRANGRDKIVTVKLGKGKNPKTILARLVRGHAWAGKQAVKDDWTLLTNLKQKGIWSRRMLLDLYHERWGIEVFFRELKQILSADVFHSQSLEGIKQELTFAMLGATLISVMEILAHVKTRRRVPRWNDPIKARCNRATLCTIIFQILLQDPRTNNISALLERELEICGKAAQKQRPGRVFVRVCKSFYGKWKQRFNRKRA